MQEALLLSRDTFLFRKKKIDCEDRGNILFGLKLEEGAMSQGKVARFPAQRGGA